MKSTFVLITLILIHSNINSPLKEWFDSLASGKGMCCSFADGKSISDVDWNTKNGHYIVRIDSI